MTVALDNVVIRYGSHLAVDGVSVVFPAGAVGLLGSNGAGKSSILKALLGLVRPSSGHMQILDLPAGARPDEIRSRIGYMPERDGHLPSLTGFEMVSLLGRLSGMPARAAYRRAHEVLYLVGLEEQRYRPVAGYSTGMRQKVKLAQALVHDPQLLFLDEPTNGLDPGGREEMLRIVGQLTSEFGKSVVLSTHILSDVEAVCESVVVLEQGRLKVAGPLSELTAVADEVFTLRVEPRDLVLPLQPDQGVSAESLGEGRYRVRITTAENLNVLFAAVVASGGEVRAFIRERRSLEDVLLGATSGVDEVAP
ncbi:MAG: ABC transporter ATP-binding protein [Planctomycetota bacterium]|nr:ABC transporter ATP-binding protein [Planctomycetota bacterium]